MGKRLSQLSQIYQLGKEDYLLIDGKDYLESKKIQFKDIDIDKFNTENFYNKISENFQEKLISGTNVKTINGQSILGQGNIEIQGGGSPSTPDTSVGQKTVEGGEIFNDYENNKALKSCANAMGTNTIAGSKAFVILSVDQGNLTMVLDSVEGLTSEMLCSCQYNSNYDFFGEIIEINNENNLVKFSALPSGTFVEGQTNLLWIPSNPELGTQNIGTGASAEGYNTKAVQIASHAEGGNTIAGGKYSHAEGNSTKAGYGAHAEGGETEAIANYSHAEGSITKAKGVASHSEGIGTISLSNASHAEGEYTVAEGSKSHTEGVGTYAKGIGAHAEGRGKNTKENINKEYGALGDYSHSEGTYTISSGNNSHAEGYSTVASGENSHVENSSSTASGNNSHAEGYNTQATMESSHSENYKTVASGRYSHAGGFNSNATKDSSFVHGYYSNANGDYSVAFGNYTKTDANYQIAVGSYNNVNERSSGQRPIFMVGNGKADSPKNNFTVFRNGVARVAANPIDNMDVATKQYVDNSINNIEIPNSGNKSLIFDTKEHLNGFIYNKNLCPIFNNINDNLNDGYGTVTPKTNGKFDLYLTEMCDGLTITDDFELEAGTYFWSTNINCYAKLHCYMGEVLPINPNTSFTISQTEKFHLYVLNNFMPNIYEQTDCWSQIEKGTTPTEFEPYTEPYTREDKLTKEDLITGDLLLVEESNTPDYYWNGTSATPIESGADLSNYLPLSGGNMDGTANINILKNQDGYDYGTEINSQRISITSNPADFGCNEASSLKSTQLSFSNIDNRSNIAYGENGIAFNVDSTDYFLLDSYGTPTFSDEAKTAWISALGIQELIDAAISDALKGEY